VACGGAHFRYHPFGMVVGNGMCNGTPVRT
jgi:hypothetical protein